MFKNLKLLISTIIAGSLLWSPFEASAAELLKPMSGPAKTDIIQKWETTDKNRYTSANPFTVKPSIKSPYLAGALSPEYITQGENTANFYRYLSGLPMNLKSLNELNDLSQHGSVLLAKHGYLSHFPSKPSDMSSDFYYKGYHSASTSNIAMLSYDMSRNMLSRTVDMYMEDSSPSNMETVGHRMWILSPYVSSIGFGLAADDYYAYSAMNVFAQAADTPYFPFSYVAYPGNGVYPKEYFKTNYPWSIGIDSKITPQDNVKVTLTRKSDGKKWTFSNAGSDGFFSVSLEGYGNVNGIIFKPDNLDYIQDGEVFSVQVTGLKDSFGKEWSIAHETEFFDLLKDKTYGKVIEEGSKSPIADADVSFFRIINGERVFYKTIKTNEDGEFEYTGFPVGEYEVVFEKSGYSRSTLGGFYIENDENRYSDYLGEFELSPEYDYEPPAAPTVNEVSDQSVAVTGNAEPASVVTVETGTLVVGKATADEDGKFSIAIPKQKAGSRLKVYATDATGNISPAVYLTVSDATAPPAPSVNAVDDNDTVVTGRAEAGAAISVKSGDRVIGTATAVGGVFSVKVSKQKAGTKLTLVAEDQAGNVSKSASVTVVDKTAPGVPVVNAVDDNDLKVTGKTESGATVVVKYGTRVIGQTVAASTGSFTIKVAKQKAGTKLSVTAADKAKNISGAKTVIVLDKTPPKAPTVNRVDSNDTRVTGKAEAGASIVIKSGSKVIGRGTANSKGSFTIKISKQKAGVKLGVTAADKAKNTSAAAVVKVVKA
ncbi:Ig-like domain-containing protein [Fictibacillus aquaticus]|uniref:Bacterial Ig domain-containing protein n=1 Tax=Fictibacillus aquaticus TaxID=2021314 RepID=A0A235F8P5_9BACL|nr:Ig-like domain-containing protein [Fictibacillus aquaticus]OYD57638.1 hypothetical protein CGZ90_13315 [Fictibacillus aquaticus]